MAYILGLTEEINNKHQNIDNRKYINGALLAYIKVNVILAQEFF